MYFLFKKNIINEYFSNYDYTITFIKKGKQDINNNDENTNNKNKKKIKKILERLKYIYNQFIFNFDDKVNNLADSIYNLLTQRKINIDDIEISNYNIDKILFNKLKINFENSDKSEESMEKPKNNFYTFNFKNEKKNIKEALLNETDIKSKNKESMLKIYNKKDNKISFENNKKNKLYESDIYNNNLEDNTIQIIEGILYSKDKNQDKNNNLKFNINEKEELKIKENDFKVTDYKNIINSYSTTLTKEKTTPLLTKLKEKKNFSKEDENEPNLNFNPLNIILPISNINSNVKINEMLENKNYKNLLGIKRKLNFNEE